MGGRVTFYDQPDMVQSDGGTYNRWIGTTANANFKSFISEAKLPLPAEIDFISGACMIVSREFYEAAGPMCEDYFLYYEEVDWSLQRGDLPLAICAEARVYHRAGTSIGSPTHTRAASPFALYFKHRAQLRFARKNLPRSTPLVRAYMFAKAAKYRLKGWKPEARAILDGTRERVPSEEIRSQLSTQVRDRVLRL